MTPVGTVVRLKVTCLRNAPGTLGYVFHEYPGGCQVIFENGMYDGFSDEEYPTYLETVGEAEFKYSFRNVMQLWRDWVDGVFTKNNCFHVDGEPVSGERGSEDEKTLERGSNEDVRAVFVDIANGVGNHGSFLTSFADTLLRADSENFQLLKPVAEELIRKYDL